MKIHSWLGGFLALSLSSMILGCGLPVAAHATATAAGGAPRKSHPYAGKEYDECGQKCIFERANENIGLQAVYLIQKISRLKSATEPERFDELGQFCMPSEDGDECFKRYKTVQVLNLYAMRTAMVKNAKVITDLSTQGKKGRTAFTPSTDGKLRKPQVPYVITFEDLQKEHATLKTLASDHYDRYVQELPKEPAEDDFRKITEIPRDPDNPEAGKLVVVGEVDKEAYQKARQKYLKSVEAQRHIDDTKKHHVQKLSAPMPANGAGAPDQLKTLPDDSHSRKSFDSAREAFVNTANKMLGKPAEPGQASPNEKDKLKVGVSPDSRNAQAPPPAKKTGKGELLVADIEGKPENQGHSLTVTIDPNELLTVIQQL
ncbi:MAG: hypothetical protein NDJ89_00715 [Oligoflexia bacterium]|nr:hypothetical protein [Oligoflexia bacterium]